MDIIDDWTLPWPAIKVPTYQTRRVGAWELRRQNKPVLRGYFRGLQACTENYSLMRDNRVWMSLSRFREEAPTTAAAAATTILDGVKADRWRILVGDDAHRLDDLVRRSPEQAYDVDFFARPAGITARGAGGER